VKPFSNCDCDYCTEKRVRKAAAKKRIKAKLAAKREQQAALAAGDIVFPNRKATLRDLDRFAAWAGLAVLFAKAPK
jgi:hypothetical protein